MVEFVMQYDKKYDILGSVSASAMKRYADRHGYRLTLSTLHHTDPAPSWGKIPTVLAAAKRTDADWVVWVDIDAVIVDPERAFEDVLLRHVSGDFFASKDRYGVCFGVFGFKVSSHRAVSLLETLSFLGDVDQAQWSSVGSSSVYPKWDQTTLKVLLKHFQSVRKMLEYVDEGVIQNPLSQFSPCAWMMHYWQGCQGGAEVQALERTARLVDEASKTRWNERLMARIE